MDPYNQLEFDKIRKIVSEYCHSQNAKNHSLQLSRLDTDEQRITSLEIITECQDILKRGYSFNFEQIVELKTALFQFQFSSYSYAEFNAVYQTVKKVLEIKKTVAKEEIDFKDFPRFLNACERLIPLPFIKSRFEEIFSPDGDVLDTASPELKQIRSRQVSLRKSILRRLENKLQDKGFENIIQDKIITQREGRYVIPLKDGGLSTIPGIVHGYSGSRASIFVEPNEIVPQNNELHSLQRDEADEINRIFCDFTNTIMGVNEDVYFNNNLLSELDYYFACARMGNVFQSHKPLLINKQTIKLINARHPLLIDTFKSREKVIPFDLSLGGDKRILILSGPNTGGKTITLKSVGLLALMTYAGLPIPADENSEIGTFDHIFTDISDEQSIENSLSTFSAHIEKIKTMVNRGDHRTLILVDEIGSATDPEQGAALAQAVLEKLLALQVVGIVTTHYTPLKLFAEKSEQCINAAMQFDPQKHQPTHHFKIGLPGNSFALEIAERLGLAGDVLSRAKSLAGEQNVELTELITKISIEKKELSQSIYRYQLKEKLFEMKTNELKKLIEEQEKEKKTIRTEALNNARTYLDNIRQKANSELDEVINADKQERKQKAKDLINNITQDRERIVQEEITLSAKEYLPVKQVAIGDSVWIKEFSDTGLVKTIEKDKITVDINGIYFTTTKDRLYTVSEKRIEKIDNKYKKKERRSDYVPTDLKTELKLLGMTFEEALPLVERFIDDGYTAGLNSLRIVHGKGTGALRSKIRKFLKTLTIVSDFHSPPQEMGGDGVTVITFNNK